MQTHKTQQYPYHNMKSVYKYLIYYTKKEVVMKRKYILLPHNKSFINYNQVTFKAS